LRNSVRFWMGHQAKYWKGCVLNEKSGCKPVLMPEVSTHCKSPIMLSPRFSKPAGTLVRISNEMPCCAIKDVQWSIYPAILGGRVTFTGAVPPWFIWRSEEYTPMTT
jgi:hypothetical protein